MKLTRYEWERCETTLETSAEDIKVDLVVNHSLPNSPENYIHRVGRTARAGKITLKTSGKNENYTQNKWKDVKLHSKRVERCKTTLETSGKDVKLHSKRVYKFPGRKGTAISIVTEKDYLRLKKIESFSKITLETSGEVVKTEALKLLSKATKYLKKAELKLFENGFEDKLNKKRLEVR